MGFFACLLFFVSCRSVYCVIGLLWSNCSQTTIFQSPNVVKKVVNGVCIAAKVLGVILSVNDVADILGLSRAYAYNLFHTEGFPTIHIGKRMMVRKEKFFEWLLAQEQEA
ncbi:MAG: helix-turn-helix domain-containing protein [Oscillospiraceae bacterium]|nr:helix-turn-helix domain-containing protein [Oscillospiraceae bacterium]